LVESGEKGHGAKKGNTNQFAKSQDRRIAIKRKKKKFW